VKLAGAKADSGIDLSNAIFLALALAEETRAFFLRSVHIMFPGAVGPEYFLGVPWDLRNSMVLDIIFWLF